MKNIDVNDRDYFKKCLKSLNEAKDIAIKLDEDIYTTCFFEIQQNLQGNLTCASLQKRIEFKKFNKQVDDFDNFMETFKRNKLSTKKMS